MLKTLINFSTSLIASAIVTGAMALLVIQAGGEPTWSWAVAPFVLGAWIQWNRMD